MNIDNTFVVDKCGKKNNGLLNIPSLSIDNIENNNFICLI